MSFFVKYSDYCTRFLVCADAFLHSYRAFSFYFCNCLPFVRVYFADDVYVVIFPSWRLRFCIRSGVYSCNILFLFTCRRFQDFSTLREGRKRARYVCFLYQSLSGFDVCFFVSPKIPPKTPLFSVFHVKQTFHISTMRVLSLSL